MTQGIDVKPAALSVPLTAKDGAPTNTSAQELKPLPFTLADIRKAIPPAAFEKNLAKSMFYLVFDYAMWGLALYTMWVFTHSPLWGELSFPLKALATVLYWNVVGFFMWCIFVVGHDCGHKTFSTYPLLNDVLGHVCHGSIAVPFYPWQLSHHYHHMYHNHVEKDFSYLWFPEDILAERPIAKAFHKAPVALAIFPFYGYFMYLLGMPDGCHYLPNLPGHRLWEIASSTESIKCLISTAAVIACLVGHFYALGGTWTNFTYYYGLPLLYFDWWLVTVTYLQHHHEESIVFDNHDWSFLIGGLETVDRTFGFGIDALHHHITDGHVVHHLFFLQIPHYNLPMATKALRAFLAPYEGYSIFTGEKTTVTAAEDLPLAQRLYKHEDTRDFIWRIHSYLVRLGFRTKRATPLPSKKTN